AGAPAPEPSRRRADVRRPRLRPGHADGRARRPGDPAHRPRGRPARPAPAPARSPRQPPGCAGRRLGRRPSRERERRRPLHRLPAAQARRPSADPHGARRRLRPAAVTPGRPRRRGSLRGRVALAAAGAIVVAVSVLGAGVQFLLSNHLHAELDATLRQRAAEIAQISATAPALLTSPGILDVSAGPRLVYVEVVDRRRRIVSRSLGLQGGTIAVDPLVAATIASGRGRYADAHLRGAEVRVYVAPLSDVGGPAAGGAVI